VLQPPPFEIDVLSEHTKFLNEILRNKLSNLGLNSTKLPIKIEQNDALREYFVEIFQRACVMM
jgi:hypothetical protein